MEVSCFAALATRYFLPEPSVTQFFGPQAKNPFPSLRLRKNSHHVVSAVNIKDVPRDGGCQRAAQKRRGIGDFLRRDGARQRRTRRGMPYHLVDVPDRGGSA